MPVTALYASNGGKPIFNEFRTPIGTVVHSYHDTPQLAEDEKTKKPILDDEGIQKAEYKVTLAWDKALLNTELIPMRTMAALTRDQAWGPEAAADPWLNLQPFLRDGDNPEHNTKKKEYLFGKVYLNFKQKAKAQRLPNGTVIYTGKPGLVGPNVEDLLAADMYPGCRALVSGIMFGTEYTGKRFISTRLNNIQKAADGERIGGGGRPDAKSQFDPLAGAVPANPLGNLVL
jgi:hypothetical protein